MAHFDFEKYQPHYDWWDCVYEDAKQIGAIIGFEIDDIFFSGFSSQGDGACFTGTLGYAKGASKAIRRHAPLDTELHALADRWTALQKSNFYSITGRVTQSGRYSHSGATDFEFEDSRESYGYTRESFDEDEATQIVRDFMDWIYEQLENDYEYQSAWQLARAWSDLADDMAERRKDARELVSAMRQERKAGKVTSATICAALRAQLASIMATWSEYREEREAIAENFHYWRDGKCQDVATFAAGNI